MRSLASPPWNSISVGIDMTPNIPGVTGLASTSTFTTLTRPSNSPARSSTMGAIILHGEHHDAQKSTSTGTSASRTSALKFASVTCWAWAMVFSLRRVSTQFNANNVPSGALLQSDEVDALELSDLAGPLDSDEPSDFVDDE